MVHTEGEVSLGFEVCLADCTQLVADVPHSNLWGTRPCRLKLCVSQNRDYNS